jgi:peptidoglycan hydrolase-like protein with peptidoglycan-binding domain
MHGESGPAVAIVQQAFIDLGLAMARSTKKLGRPDGIFGGETESRVWQFQARTGLERDGIVALRFVRKTASKLGMQRFPLTVCIEVRLSRPGSDEYKKAVQGLAFKHAEIPRWGQEHSLNEATLPKNRRTCSHKSASTPIEAIGPT